MTIRLGDPATRRGHRPPGSTRRHATGSPNTNPLTLPPKARSCLAGPPPSPQGRAADRRSLARTFRTSVEGVTLRVSVGRDVFSLHESLWPGGFPRTPVTTSRAPKGPQLSRFHTDWTDLCYSAFPPGSGSGLARPSQSCRPDDTQQLLSDLRPRHSGGGRLGSLRLLLPRFSPA